MVDIQCATAEIRRGKRKKKERRKKPQDENIMACPITQCGHKNANKLETQRRYVSKRELSDYIHSALYTTDGRRVYLIR